MIPDYAYYAFLEKSAVEIWAITKLPMLQVELVSIRVTNPTKHQAIQWLYQIPNTNSNMTRVYSLFTIAGFGMGGSASRPG